VGTFPNLGRLGHLRPLTPNQMPASVGGAGSGMSKLNKSPAVLLLSFTYYVLDREVVGFVAG
jgi:hypothetical protein